MVNYFLRIVACLILLTSSAQAFTLPGITAKSWLVADGDGKILKSYNPDQVRSIASVSKLMLAMVVLDKQQDLTERVGMTLFTRHQLLQMSLVHSDNRATQVLCEEYPGGKDECVKDMNIKAHFLGMAETKFVEPTGLSVFNVSTATDLIKLVQAASKYQEIEKAAGLTEVKVKIKKRWFIFKNTNPIIGKKHKFIVSKTGYIRASGGCIVMMLDTDVGQRIVVILGSKNTHTRIPEAEFIAEKY